MLISDYQLTQLIFQEELADEKEVAKVVDFAKKSNTSLYDALVEKGLVSDEKLGQLIARYLNLPFIRLTNLSIADDIFSIIPERVARKQKIIPFARDESGIKLAVFDPENKVALEMISKKTDQPVYPNLATVRDIYNTLHIYKKDIQKAIEELLNREIRLSTDMTISDAPISKIVDLIIDYAYQYKASDIHIEPQEKSTLVRFRIDGILHDVLYLPKHLHDRIITRLKVLARLRTDEHLAPQDGKIRVNLDEEVLDLRVSFLPIADGEKAVLRLLSSRTGLLTLADLGMNESDLSTVTRAMHKSFGMILSTGPTGSGKTTTIYAILKILHTREKNITTIEDPVEYRIAGVNQIQENTKTGLTFAQGLRSILRQDPNIIFVGEIRDGETAGIAVNAALTGHLVLSTLHTNDAATALPRLTDMKVEPFLVASTVNIIIAQRLIRRLCDSCKFPVQLPSAELALEIPMAAIRKHFGTESELTCFRGKGCTRCHTTGFSGRIGIFEVLEVTSDLRKLITARADSDSIEKAAISQGMTTLLDDGLDKVKKGLTTLEEVLTKSKYDA